MAAVVLSDDTQMIVSRFYGNLDKFFDLIKSIVVTLKSKGHQVPGPEILEIGKQIVMGSSSSKTENSFKHRTPITMFLRLNKHHASLSNRDADFFEKNMNSIFNLPDILSNLATSIVSCKTKNEDGTETLDIPDKSVNTMFIATQALATNGLRILYALADPSGYTVDDNLGYRVYSWRHDPKSFFSYLPQDDQDKLGVESFDLSHAIHVWAPKDLPDPK